MTRRSARVPAQVAAMATTRAPARMGCRRRFVVVMPAAETSTSPAARSGNWIATSAAVNPPIELPTSTASPRSSSEQSASTQRPKPEIDISSAGISDSPWPGRSTAITLRSRPILGMFSSQFCHDPPSPWTMTTGGPSPDPWSQ